MLPAFDLPLFHLLNAGPHSPTAYIATARWASTWLPGLCGALLAVWALRSGTAGRKDLYSALSALALAWVTSKLIRWGFPLPRPAHYGLGLQWIAHAPDASLPSLHAAGAFALAQALQLGRLPRPRWLAPLVWAMAALVALSRVVLGVHFPSDIVAGMAVGCASAWLVTQLARRVWPSRVHGNAAAVRPQWHF